MAAIVRMVLVALVAGSLIQASLYAASRESFLLAEETLSQLQKELSGEQVRDQIIAITRYHRAQASRGYSEAAQYVLEQLHSAGFSPQEAWTESFKADGKTEYQTWRSPSGWHIESAELRLVEPRREVLARYPDVALSVITHSNAGQLRGDLVDVGAGTSDEDYQDKELEGRFVLANGDSGEVHRLAVLKYGASAIICYPGNESAAEYPDKLRDSGIRPTAEELERVRFGFNITPRQGQKLKDLLSGGKRVVLDAKVNGPGLEPGTLDVVAAVIPGGERPEQELVYIAHLDHSNESASDNAAGCAVSLHIARTLKRLISEEKLPRPKRTLRFLWVPRFNGTMAYVDAHPELQGPQRGGSVLAALNLDMESEPLENRQSQTNITWTPPSISSALTDVATRTVEYADIMANRNPGVDLSGFNYRIVPFRAGGDHAIFNDGMIGVPAVTLSHQPSHTQRSQEEIPVEVDPVDSAQLKRCALIASTTFWYLANLSEIESLELTNLVAANGHGRLASDVQRAADRLLKVTVDGLDEMYDEGKRLISFAVERETRTLESILDFVPSVESTRRLVRTWNETLENQAQLNIQVLQALVQQRGGTLSFSPQLTPEEREASQLIPLRVTRGPLAPGLPRSRLTSQEQAWYEEPQSQILDSYLLVNFIDGRRSILDIRNDLSATTEPVALEAVERYIRDLAKLRLVELRRRR